MNIEVARTLVSPNHARTLRRIVRSVKEDLDEEVYKADDIRWLASSLEDVCEAIIALAEE